MAVEQDGIEQFLKLSALVKPPEDLSQLVEVPELREILSDPFVAEFSKLLRDLHQQYMSTRVVTERFEPFDPRLEVYAHYFFELPYQFTGNKNPLYDVAGWQSLALNYWRSGRKSPISEDHIGRHFGTEVLFKPSPRTSQLTDDIAVQISHWPLSRNRSTLEFVDRNLQSALVVGALARNSGGVRNIFSVHREPILCEDLTESLPILSFAAELVFYQNPDQFEAFMDEMIVEIGGRKGIAAALSILLDLTNDYKSFFQFHEQYPSKLHNRLFLERGVTLDLLTKTLSHLEERYKLWKYSNRSKFASTEILAQASEKPHALWETLYGQNHIQQTVEKFLASDSTPAKSIRESLTRERKIIPGLVLLTAQALGLDYDSAKDLAARAFFSWGVIIAFDDILDKHQTRKGQPTNAAVSGNEISLDHTMISFIQFARQSLGDSHLTEHLLEMMQTSFEGELASRKLGWDDPIESYFAAAEKMVSAFSWFGQYIGEITHRPETGEALGAFFANINTIGQISNDVEDLSPGSKHEAVADPISRISIFWRAFMDLPDDKVEKSAKDFVRAIYEKALTTKSLSEDDRAELQAIGLRHKTLVAKILKLLVNLLASKAHKNLNDSFANLPMDQPNLSLLKFFEGMLQEAQQRFTELGWPLPKQELP